MACKIKFAQIESTMITLAEVWVSSIVITISTRYHDVWKDGIKRTCVYLHKTWNLPTLMEMKESQITSCVAMHFFFNTMKYVYPFQIYGLIAYASRKTTSCGMGRPNVVHSVEKKLSKAILKYKMIRQAKSQTFKPGLAQDFNQTQWQLEDNANMMLKDECSCTFLKMLF